MTKKSTKKNLSLIEKKRKCSTSGLKKDISSRNNQSKSADFSLQKEVGQNIFEIRTKLDDPSYIEGAVYRLATVITNRILKLRGEL